MGVPDGKRSYSRREVEIPTAGDVFDVDALGIGNKDRNGAGHASRDIPLTHGEQVGVLLPWPLRLSYAGR
jgi:hypothetical protein